MPGSICGTVDNKLSCPVYVVPERSFPSLHLPSSDAVPLAGTSSNRMRLTVGPSSGSGCALLGLTYNRTDMCDLQADEFPCLEQKALIEYNDVRKPSPSLGRPLVVPSSRLRDIGLLRSYGRHVGVSILSAHRLLMS